MRHVTVVNQGLWTAILLSFSLSGQAHAQAASVPYDRPQPVKPDGFNGITPHASRRAYTLNAEQAKRQDGLAQQLYNSRTPPTYTGDPKLSDALKANDYAYMLSYYQVRCKSGNVTTAIDDYLEKGTGVGNCHDLARLYQDGLGTPVNIPQAISDYQMAADGGYWPAVQRLAYIYFTGQVVPQNTAKGLERLVHFTTDEKTSAAYVCLGAKTLGDLYRQGLYVAQNGQTAADWYDYCHDHSKNDDSVPRWLTARTASVQANMYADANGPLYKPALAVGIYQRLLGYRSIDASDAVNAQYRLGQMYLTGTGVSKDPRWGVKLLKMAADTGKNSDAALVLAKLYTAGDTVPADPVQADQYLMQAANGRNAEAQYLVGEKALNQPVPDVKEGLSWLQSAAVLGYGKAQYALAEQYLKDAAPVNAYVWFDFAAQNRDDRAVKARDDLAAKLTPDEITKAKSIEGTFRKQFATVAPAG